MLKKYKQHLILEGKSENTINDYISKLNLILNKVPLKDITQEKINNLLLKIKSTKSQNTYNKYLAILRSYFTFKNLNITLPKDVKIDKKLPNVISQEYFEKQVIPIIYDISRKPYRDIAILYFMFYTGIRVSEIEKVSRKNMNLEKREILITSSKGKSQFKTFFPERIKKHFTMYFQLESEMINAFNIKTEACKNLFKRINKYLEDINFHPHLLRASFATMYLENGGDIVYLSELLGHKNISTTMKYLNINPTKRKENYNKVIK